MNDKSFRLTSLLVGAVMISFSGVWVKISHVAPEVSAFYRVLFGGLILVVPALYRREVQWKGRRYFILCLACGFFFALDLCFYHYSIHFVGPGLGTILPNLQVFILAFVGLVFLGEKIRPLFIVSIPIAVFGLFLIVGTDWANLGSRYKTGIYLGLAAALCYSAFLLSLRKLQSDQGGLSFFFVLMTVSFSSSVFLGIEVLRGGETFAIPDTQSIFALLTLGLLSQCIGWILITNALPGIKASLSGLILLLQPCLAFVWDVLFFQRPTGFLNWFGVLMVLAGIYLGSLKPAGPKKQPE